MRTLSELRALVEASLIEEGYEGTAVIFGRQHLYRRDRQGAGTANRVVIAPGDPEGNRGSIRPCVPVNRASPDRFMHMRRVTVQVWGYDSAAGIDEGKQDDAVEILFQGVVRALQAALIGEGHGIHTLYEADETYPVSPNERTHGSMAQIVFDIGFSVRKPEPSELIEASVNNGTVTLTGP